MADGTITIKTELDTKSFDAQITALERKANDLEQILSSPKDLGLSSAQIQETEVELEKTKNKLIQIRKQQDGINASASKNVLGKSLSDSVKKASRLVLAIFGIRSAYLAVRRASSELASYDSQYAANLEYIRYALTQAIAPVLRYIVNLAATLLGYLNAILQGWFGINIFANASAKSFQKMKAGAGGVSKAVKEIKKQLAGFDEMNVLSAQTSAGGGRRRWSSNARI